ncbi:MAG: amino acid adenylation domain-containing protein [Proteobacteria bacterium]|nr:amino acid adenylation domain-containing protein [Pseudomonadota bacterium]
MKHYAKLLTSQKYQGHIDFWTASLQRLAGSFHFRQTWQSYPTPDQPVELSFGLQDEPSRRVAELGKYRPLGVFVLALSGWFHVLSRYAGKSAISVCTPLVKNGVRQVTYGETIPILVDLNERQTVRELIGAVREFVGNASTYQDFPIDEVFEVIGSPVATSNVLVECPAIHHRVVDRKTFDLIITIHLDMARFDRVDIEARPLETPPVNAVPVEQRPLDPWQSTAAISFTCTANPTYFSEPFLVELARACQRALSGLADLDRSLAELSSLDNADRKRILRLCSAASRPPLSHQTIDQQFEMRVAEHPFGIALIAGDRRFTYQELDRKANRLAHFLSDQYRVRPGDRVALLADRSELGTIALLAILKAGAVYLPIDANLPNQRLALVLRDAGVRALLVQAEHLSSLGGLHDIPTLALDLQLDTLDTPTHKPAPRNLPESPAYIIYTSGSTGVPKGVLLSHRGFLNMILDHIQVFGITPSDRVSRFYSLAFDSSLFEIFAALLAGATSIAVAQEIIDDPTEFSHLMEREQISLSVFPPVYLSHLDPNKLATLKTLLNAGDASNVEDARNHARHRAYYNSYGPTETSVCATYYRVDPAREYGPRIPIGRAIANTSVYILDEQLQLMPEGVVGEICIAGPGLAVGYWNRPALTAESFVPNPFGEGDRLYCTGDLGVMLADGNLEFIGRKDNQVKIRGYRIELNEIEAVLLQHAEVEEVVVLARVASSGQKQLAAYYTSTEKLSALSLRAFLAAKLPEYMIPALFVPIEQWPLTPNGKIDRNKLPEPTRSQGEPETDYREPTTAVQRTLTEIWQDVLGMTRVGIDDNFFELGGDSILIIQMVARANERGLHLKPKDLFEHQTIADLANVATSKPKINAEQGPVTGPVPLTPIQRWFFDQNLPQPHHFNQSVLLEVPPTLQVAALKQALAAVLDHHDALRARFWRDGQAWRQTIITPEERVARSGDADLDIVDLAGLSAAERDRELLDSATQLQASLDIENGPTVRVRLFDCGLGQTARLLCVVHHLVIDGVSWRILLEDFHTAYQQVCAGQVAHFSAKTTSYQAWAEALSTRSVGKESDHADYWQTVVADIDRLPTDYPWQPNNNTVDAQETVTIALSRSDTIDLLQRAPRAYNTQINDILLTAVLFAFKSLTGADHLVLDLESHGREELFPDIDLSRTVGWFTSLFPVALRLCSDRPGQALKAVKEQLRRVPDRGISYGLLRGTTGVLQADSGLDTKPDAIFNYLGQTDRVLTPSLQWRPIKGAMGPEHGPRNSRSHLLAIDAIVMHECLEVTWTYGSRIHKRSTVEHLAERFRDALIDVVQHCCHAEVKGYTPSDFPAAGLNQRALDTLIAKINA